MKLQLIYGFLLLLIHLTAAGQQRPITGAGELRIAIQKSRNDSTRVDLSLQLTRIYLSRRDREGSFVPASADSAITILDEVIRLSDSLKLTRRKYELLGNQAEAYLQTNNIAEAKKKFANLASIYISNNDPQRAGTTLYRLGKMLPRGADNYKAICGAFQNAINLFHDIGNKQDEGITRVELADVYYLMQKYNLAEEEALKAVTLLQQIGYKKLYDVYYILSVIYRYKGELDKSLVYATKCLQNAEEAGGDNTGFFTGELALVYEEIGKTNESEHWYRITLDKLKAQGTQSYVIYRTAGLLSRQLIKLKKEQEGLSVLNEVEKKYPPQSPLEKAAVYQFKAYCFDALNQFENAEFHFQQMEKQYDKASTRDGFASIGYADFGRFYLRHRQYEKAHQYLAKAWSGQDVPSYKMDVLLLLFKADSAMGKYYEAVNDLQRYETLKDSIFNDKKTKQVEELQIQYETAKKEKEIFQLNNKNRSQQIQLRKTALIRNIIIAGILTLFGFLYYRYRLKQKINRQLEAQQEIINRKNISLEHLVKEKEWLVKEIHHRVKNNFHIVQGLLGTQAGYLKSEEAISALTDSLHRVQAMSLIHQKLYQSENLSAINMRAYIHELVSYLSASFNTGNSILFKLEVDPVNLDLTHSIPLGLIMNEAITNSIKYAFPDRLEKVITISFRQEAPNHFSLSIKDNGVGMPKDFAIQQASSMGIKLMKGLSEDIDAAFSMHSEQGTEVRLGFIYQPAESSTIQSANKPALTD